MGPFLYAAWLRCDDADAGGFVESVRRGAPVADAYSLVTGGATIQAIGRRLRRIDSSADVEELPTHLVLADVDALPAALALRDALDGTSPTPVLTALFAKIATYPGTHEASDHEFAPAIQLGTFDMPSAADDWAITAWYEQRRMPAFQAMQGAIRSFRLATVCGGLTRVGVFYEFASMQLRDASFEGIEEQDHDETRPTAATRTVHPRMSPSIGARLPR